MKRVFRLWHVGAGTAFIACVIAFASAPGTLQPKLKSTISGPVILEPKPDPTTRILYAKREIPKDSNMNPTDVEGRETRQSQIPQGALSSKDIPKLAGKTVKYGISAGQIVCNHDLYPHPWGFESKQDTEIRRDR